jgi:hypothetical protein
MGSSCGKQVHVNRSYDSDSQWTEWKQYYEDGGDTICKIRHNLATNKSEIIKTKGHKMPGNFLDREEYNVENSWYHPRSRGQNGPSESEQLRMRNQVSKPQQTINVNANVNSYGY